MIKKLISLTLIGLMSISMLTGCGVNELGYLKLSNELSKVTEFSFENSTQIQVSKELVGEDYNIDLELEGVVNLVDLESMYMSFDLLFKVNEIEVEKPINFKIIDNQLYVSKTALLEIIALEEILDGTTESRKVIQELYSNDLKDVEYILLTDLGTEYNGMTNTDMSENAMDYLKTAFKGFDSNLITKTSKGYSIELTSENVLSFVKNLITYLSENKELVFDETVKYVEELYSNIEIQGITEVEKEEMFAELRESRQDFYDFVDEAVLVMESGEFDNYTDMIDGSKIKQEMYKEGKAYKEIVEIELVVEDDKMVNFVSNTTITPESVKKSTITGNVIVAEELDSLYNKVENRVNPVQRMEIEWYNEEPSALVSYQRLEGNTDIDFQPYKIIEGRIYLPLRYICESFGEEVEWNNATSKAYIVRGEEKIDMTGIIIDSKTMVKVRDFEKLGYTVDYTKNEESSTAIIAK